MDKQTDILIIGSCSAGLYFGGLMAKQGFNVILCDKSKEENLGARFDVIHIAQRHFAEFGIPEPGPGDDDYIETFHAAYQRSALDKYPKLNHEDICVLRRVPLMKRIRKWAEEQAASGTGSQRGSLTILFETEFIKPLFQNGTIRGGILKNVDGEVTITSSLVVDASGIDAVVRTQLPDNYGVETFVTGPRDQFYVVLQYISLKDKSKTPTNNTFWPYYKCWFAPAITPADGLFGVGANLSFEYAEKCWQRFNSRIPMPPHELLYKEKGSTPYRRPPFSLVADNFLVLGDAACITNPWSGEGVPYGMLLCKIAAGVIGQKDAKNTAQFSKMAMWPINKEYFGSQGAEFAANLVMLSGAIACTPEENDYEFSKSIIFEDETEKGKGNLVAKLIGALFAGGISLKSLKALMSGALLGGKISAHYKNFPLNLADYPAWEAKAKQLWAKSANMADLAEEDLKTMV
ncbi:MAG: FAD-dependent monooxygenase [Spirochaetaceae bacterium]|jgi:flavin-dependent dehydrogenase|nr:FAD-dependent monooxygenase [Spirochaetaceae bacterium]